MLDMLTLEPFTAQREWTVDNIPVLTASITLPHPVGEHDRPTRRLNRYYQLYARSYLRYCERWLFPQAAESYRLAIETSSPLPQDTATLSYCVTCNGCGVLSLFVDSKECTGGRTESRRHGDTWDLATGYPIPLSACFHKKSPWRKSLLRVAEQEIDRQERAGMARYHEGWRRLLRRNFNSENFYLTETSLCWYWQMYSIAPAAEGIPVFSSPYGENDCFFPGNRGKILETS